MIDRDAVVAALRPEDVDAAYSMSIRWRGQWGRSAVCPFATHGTQCMAVSRRGMVRCHACSWGGDLLALVAAFEGLDVKQDFRAVLERAAEIAGVVDDMAFGPPTPRAPRPPPAPRPELAERVESATRRAAWLWARLQPLSPSAQDGGYDRPVERYLRSRGIDCARWSHELRATPAAIREDEARRVGGDLYTLWAMWSRDTLGVAIPVRHVATGSMTDVRHRVLPAAIREGSPKIHGMIGGVTSHENEAIACYGRPHEISRSVVVCCEGWADYLSLAQVFPEYDTIGAVDAGQLVGVVSHAAMHCAETGARLVIACQDDGPRGAADRSVDAAAAAALHVLPATRIAWLECASRKDVNEILVKDGEPALRAKMRSSMEGCHG